MLVVIVGESCVGKSTLAQRLQELMGGEVYTGKDYLRLAKNEAIAKKLFVRKLTEAVSGANLNYVISEQEHLSLIPQDAVVIRMTADLALILERLPCGCGETCPSLCGRCWSGSTAALMICPAPTISTTPFRSTKSAGIW